MHVAPLFSSIVLSILMLVPLSIKWELEKRIIFPAAIIIGLTAWIVAEGMLFVRNMPFYQIILCQAFLIATTSISLLLWRFFRDPERLPPDGDTTILSPADGKIIYVKKIANGQIPFSEKQGTKYSLRDFVKSDVLQSGGYLIGVAMNYLDVHVNRAPIGGTVFFMKYIKGTFLSLKRHDAVFQNERLFTVIDNGTFRLGILQIASRLVRKIVPYVIQGQHVSPAERIGKIRFGSQVDLLLPQLPSLKIKVKPGQKVKAGVSIIADF